MLPILSYLELFGPNLVLSGLGLGLQKSFFFFLNLLEKKFEKKKKIYFYCDTFLLRNANCVKKKKCEIFGES